MSECYTAALWAGTTLIIAWTIGSIIGSLIGTWLTSWLENRAIHKDRGASTNSWPNRKHSASIIDCPPTSNHQPWLGERQSPTRWGVLPSHICLRRYLSCVNCLLTSKLSAPST